MARMKAQNSRASLKSGETGGKRMDPFSRVYRCLGLGV